MSVLMTIGAGITAGIIVVVVEKLIDHIIERYRQWKNKDSNDKPPNVAGS